MTLFSAPSLYQQAHVASPASLEQDFQQIFPSRDAPNGSRLVRYACSASDAAAIALLTQQTPAKAVSWLEAGRSVLASAIQDRRTDTSDLYQQHPKLAATFDKLRAILDAPTRIDRLVSQEGSLFNPPQSEADRRRKAEEQLNETSKRSGRSRASIGFSFPPRKPSSWLQLWMALS